MFAFVLAGHELDLYSAVEVRHDTDGRITSLKDQWRGVPLLSTAPFRWARRANGLLSYRLTPFL